LKGISTSQFETALKAILGTNYPGLSSSTISDMMKQWQSQYEDWNNRNLERPQRPCLGNYVWELKNIGKSSMEQLILLKHFKLFLKVARN
jgi:transposase-like protein